MFVSLASLHWDVKVASPLKAKDVCPMVRKAPTNNSSAVLCRCEKTDALHKMALSSSIITYYGQLSVMSVVGLRRVFLQKSTCCGYSERLRNV